jgi:hypothetical protein
VENLAGIILKMCNAFGSCARSVSASAHWLPPALVLLSPDQQSRRRCKSITVKGMNQVPLAARMGGSQTLFAAFKTRCGCDTP